MRLDGEERPVRGELVRSVLSRIGGRLAPTVLEVHEHSSNPVELSLEREHEDGRREELYLNNDELRQRLAAVPDRELGLYAPIPFRIEGRSVLEEPAGEPAEKPRLELASVEVDLDSELSSSASASASASDSASESESASESASESESESESESASARPSQPAAPRRPSKPAAPRRPSKPAAPRRPSRPAPKRPSQAPKRPSQVPPVAAVPKKRSDDD